MKITIGTRGSNLAIVQANWVKAQLKEKNLDIIFEVKVIKTKGDINQTTALDKMGDKGIFVKEIEEALNSGEIDMAIHSMKDMPSDLPQGLKLSYCPIAEDARDALVTPHNINNIRELPKGARIGTGSKRRSSQLLELRDDFLISGIRGNVETRINKMLNEGLDGIILAYCGIIRLGIEKSDKYKVIPIDVKDMIPAPCQGILAIEIRENDLKTEELIEKIKDDTSHIRGQIERDYLINIEGGCHAPTGAYAEIIDDEVKLNAIFGDMEAKKIVRYQKVVKLSERETLAKQVAEKIKNQLFD